MSELQPPTPLPFFRTDPTTRLAWGGYSRWQAPIWLKLSVVAGVVLTWLPIAVAIEMRTNMHKADPRVHIIQDMDNQTKYKAQDESVLFNDGRAYRGRVPGTVARGELFADGAFFNGFADAAGADGKTARTFLDAYPDQVQQTLNDPDRARAFLALGQQKFNITCAMCHGQDGQGNGPIAIRAAQAGAATTGWVQPSNLMDPVRRGRADGHLYNTVNNGIRKMGGYGHQLSPNERWAVVAYVRTLQLAEGAPRDVLTAEQQRALQ